MRARIPLIIEQDLLTKIDVITGDQKKRSTVIEKAVREFIAREEAKGVITNKAEAIAAKTK